MDCCDDCARLEHELCGASEHYVGLIVPHDQMIRDGAQDAIAVEDTIKHEDVARVKTRPAGQL